MSLLVRPLTGILGLVLAVVGVAGFFQPGSMLLVFEISPLHNVIHLLSGIVGLLCYNAGRGASKAFLTIFGLVYAAVAVIGFVMGGDILGLFHANTADNFLHLAIGAVCLIVGLKGKK